jgi:hypothetical protein
VIVQLDDTLAVGLAEVLRAGSDRFKTFCHTLAQLDYALECIETCFNAPFKPRTLNSFEGCERVEPSSILSPTFPGPCFIILLL